MQIYEEKTGLIKMNKHVDTYLQNIKSVQP